MRRNLTGATAGHRFPVMPYQAATRDAARLSSLARSIVLHGVLSALAQAAVLTLTTVGWSTGPRRLVLAPVFFVLFELAGQGPTWLLALVCLVFAAIEISDLLDGHAARALNQESDRLGQACASPGVASRGSHPADRTRGP